MDVVEAFRTQAAACESLGSPMYGDLLARLAGDLEAGGPTGQVLQGHRDDPGPSGLALRLAGSLHRLVLAGAAPELAAYYPSVGGTWTADGVAAVLDLLERRAGGGRPPAGPAPPAHQGGPAPPPPRRPPPVARDPP